jgi:hypothetical protein
MYKRMFVTGQDTNFFSLFKKPPPYTLAGFDLTTHSSSVAGGYDDTFVKQISI